MGNLILPKQISSEKVFIATLEILEKYYDKGDDWVPNKIYKKEIIARFDHLTEKTDSAAVVKQSEIVRYFGFAKNDFKKRQIAINDKGLAFLEAHQDGDNEQILDYLAESILENSFGRNNAAIKSGDSDIDPPKLFVKAILALNGITNKEFAILLSLTHDDEYDFDSAIYVVEQLRISRGKFQTHKNKYEDTKFIPFLHNIGFCKEKRNHRSILSKYVDTQYRDDFAECGIYNETPEKVDNIILETDSLSMDLRVERDYREQILKQKSFDISSKEFKNQNNREPQKTKLPSGRRVYQTNMRISKTALQMADYTCTYNNEHKTFTSKSGKPFMEPHHLIPMAAQDDFSINLDCVENIVCLCPNCHSAIHYGNKDTRKKYLKKIYNLQIDKLEDKDLDIEFDELFKEYYK